MVQVSRAGLGDLIENWGVTNPEVITLQVSNGFSTVKEINRRLILESIRVNSPTSRADIARETGLHPSTITRIVASLIEEGLVREEGVGENDLGRKPILLSLVPEAIHVIGVAIESTFISGVLANLDAEIVAKIEVALEDTSVDGVRGQLIEVVDYLLAWAKRHKVSVIGIGIAMHGIIDTSSGTSVFAPAYGWHDVPMAHFVNNRYKLPVRIDNNANAMALGEYWFGNGKGVDNLLVIKMGQAVGSGIVLDGKIFRGPDYLAGEIGHLTVMFDGPLCRCGNFGCLEAVTSIESVVRKARLQLKRGSSSALLDLVHGDPDLLSFQELCEGAKSGDRLALELWEEVGSHLGLAIANTVNILNPTKILVGGDIYPALDYILPRAQEIAKLKAFGASDRNLTVERVGLGADAVSIGAVTLILREIFQPLN